MPAACSACLLLYVPHPRSEILYRLETEQRSTPPPVSLPPGVGPPKRERRPGVKRVAQGDSSGAATSRSQSSAAKGQRKAGPKARPKRKPSKLDLDAPRVGGVHKCKGKAKAKRSAGSPASRPQPEPEEVEILKLEWPVKGNLLADNTPPPSPQPSARHRKRSLAPPVDTLAAKRPRAAPSVAQQAEALKELAGGPARGGAEDRRPGREGRSAGAAARAPRAVHRAGAERERGAAPAPGERGGRGVE